MSKVHKVFCYGSLKRGYGNHRLLEQSDFISEDETENDKLQLRCFGAYPGVYLDGNNTVKGELYEVDDETFRRLDGLEGYPTFYDRMVVALKSGEAAWMYYLHEEPRGRLCEDGVWGGYRG